MRCAVMHLPTALLLLAGAAMADDPGPVELARKSIEAVNANGAKTRQYAYRITSHAIWTATARKPDA
jgi:hypothetical protein